MDFGAVTAKKFSNGYGVPGKSAYEGVFASPVKFRAPSVSSSFQDYCEIFSGSDASIGSSIPVLEVPELNETKILHDMQRSKLDYSKVFGGFGNLDTAVPYEELFADSKKKDGFSKGASQDEGRNLSSKEDSSNCSKQVPLVSQETSYGATEINTEKINMSYHKINRGRENKNNGTTYIAQLHAVPAYTCLIEEVDPLKINIDDQSIPELQHAYTRSDCLEGIKEKEHCTKSVNDPSPDSSMKESFKAGIRFQDRSNSVNMVFDASEVSHESDSAMKQSSNSGVKVQEISDSISMFFNVVGNLDDHGHAVRSVATQCQVSASEAAAGADSPGHLDDMIDSSSEAAASVAALRKAMEEAQERLKVAKDLMKRKKEGFPNRIKRRLNNDLKAEGKREDKFVHKTMGNEGTSLGQTFGEMDVLPQKSSVTGKPMMRKEQATLDLREEEIFVAKEVVRGPDKLESTLAETSKEEKVEHKEAAHEETLFFESKHAENYKEVLSTVDDYNWYKKNAGKNAFEKQAEFHQTIEVFGRPCGPEANEEKVNVDDEAGHYEEPVDAKTFMWEELVDDTKLAQETLDSGGVDKNLEVEDEPATDDKVAAFLEQEESERKIGEEGLSMGDEKRVNCKSEDEKRVEGPCVREECSRNWRDHQEFIERKKKVTQEETESEEIVESFSHMKEFELKEDMKSIENGKAFNIHDSDLRSMERQMKNWSCVEEGKKVSEAVLLALNQETEHHYQRDGNVHMQEILGDADDEEGFHDVMSEDSDPDRNERVEDAKGDGMEIKGAIYLTEETEKRSSEPVKIMEVIENSPDYEEKKIERKKVSEAVLLALNQETEHHYQRDGNVHMQEILGDADDEEGFHDVMSEDSDPDRNERVEDAKGDGMEINGAIYLTEKTEKHSSEPVKIMEVIENSPNYEEIKTEEADRTREISPNNELDGYNLSKVKVVADTRVECDKIPEVTPGEYSLSEQDLAASVVSPQHEEKCNEPESRHVINNLGEKFELTSTLAQGVLQLNEAMNRMQYANETVSFDRAATNIGDPREKVEQNPSDCWKQDEDNCNLELPVEEPYSELGDVKEEEDGLKAKIDENQCNSYEEILVDNKSTMEASQPPLISEQKPSTSDHQELGQSNLKNYEAALTMKEKKEDETSQKVELDIDSLKQNQGAKEKQREREREKEKIAVERAIREARERAFAEARERVALERAAAGARRKNVSDGRERLVKTTGHANEKTSTERAAMEAKLKAERAAVERATAEARARALERALSEKAASESRNKSDKFFTEKSFGASRDNGMKTNFHSKSFTYGETFDGANGDSAQRCKARSERHQRIGERVAKALAEKDARDRLIQKEQEERNRVAEALDGDVKRWSSGKEGNLRALLSTLQYILGPDNGWQPIHLTDIVNNRAVKKAYRKATLFVHPDKLQQRGASIRQKYVCEKVFDLLKEAWNKFNMEER